MMAYTNWNQALIREHERRLVLIGTTAEKWNRKAITEGKRRFLVGVYG